MKFHFNYLSIKLIVGLCYFTFNIHAFEKPAEQKYLESAKVYSTFLPLGTDQSKLDGKSPKEVFALINESISATHSSGVFHKHIKEGLPYGRSFTVKNVAPLNCVTDLITGKAKWKRDVIESGSPIIKMADIGAGIGLSAMYFVSRCISIFEEEKWKLAKPIELNLYELKKENVLALNALCDVVNAAYPQYFQLKALQHDIQTPFSQQDYYKIAFVLNVLHYIHKSKWGVSLTNLRKAMQTNGILLLTTDHYNCLTVQMPSLVETFRMLSTHFPFFCTTVVLFNPNDGLEKGTMLINYAGQNIFKNENIHTPGGIYGVQSINLVDFSKFMDVSMKGLNRQNIPVQEGDKQVELSKQDIIDRLKAGTLSISTGAYAFDNETLEKNIISCLAPAALGFTVLRQSWIYDPFLQRNSAGITLLANKK
jgi:hypothetical protein